jgi:hypothetical protein
MALRGSVEGPPPDNAHCGIPNVCAREVPDWLVALDNGPTILLFVLGAAIMWLIWWPLAILFLAYCAASIVLFWAVICPYCHHFGTKACPCGYGVVARRFFKRKSSGDFRRVFRRNIAIMFPVWIVPLVGGIYLLWTGFSWLNAGLFIAFCVDGFAIIPAISIFVGCKGCEIKDCPWRPSSPAGT